MNSKKPKSEVDQELDEALDETFPASDAIAIDTKHDQPIRPVDRLPPRIDKSLVEKLAKKAKSKSKQTQS